jgi:hypothetical protein
VFERAHILAVVRAAGGHMSRAMPTARWMLAALALALLVGCAPPAAAPPPVATASEVETVSPPLQGFYGKRLREGGIPILGHASVSDEGLLAARDCLHRILEHAPKIRRNLEARGHELHVIGLRQFTSDLPEHRDQRGKRIDTGQLFDWHMIGGHIVGNLSSCAEATLLPIVGHRLFGDEPCLHELGHAVELLGLDNASRGRVNAAYRRSMESGHWKNKYAAKNEREWFAELTRYYFRPEGDTLAFYDPQASQGRAWLRGEDPEGFQLVDDLYAGRTDPGVPRTRALPLGPASAEAALRSRKESDMPSQLSVHNGTAGEIRLVWIDFEGRRDPRLPPERMPSAPPGGTITESSWAGHTFVVTDAAGRGLCTLSAADDDGTVDVIGPCP